MSDVPTLIIFDLGRVLVDFDFHKVVRALRRYTTLTEKEIAHYFRHTATWDAFERGTITPEAFFRGLTRGIRLRRLTLAQFTPLWNDIFTVKEDTLAIVRELRGRYRLAMLSNVNVMHWDHLWERHDFMKWFDPPIASYAVGQRKPETDIYHTVLHRANVPPSRAIFIDDVEAHITAARRLGIRAHLFINAGQLRRDLADLLE